MSSAEQVIADEAMRMFAVWPVGKAWSLHDGLGPARPECSIGDLLSGIETLVQVGIERDAAWPPHWVTDGIIPSRCVRRNVHEVELVGRCWVLRSRHEGDAMFALRVVFSVESDAAARSVAWFEFEIGSVSRMTDEVPLLPMGAVISFEDPDAPTSDAVLLAFHRAERITWTRVTRFDFIDQ